MVKYNIDNVKYFIQALLGSDVFDSYYLSEANIVTFNTFHIDGHLKKEFYKDTNELCEIPDRDYSLWKENRSFCFNIIKGKRVPLQFKFVLQLPQTELERLVSEDNITIPIHDIGGCFLNISYNSGVLSCTSGTSLKTFSIDKSLEQSWDKFVEHFLAKHNFI